MISGALMEIVFEQIDLGSSVFTQYLFSMITRRLHRCGFLIEAEWSFAQTILSASNISLRGCLDIHVQEAIITLYFIIL